MGLTAGVVAVQGATRAHAAAFDRLAAATGRDIEVQFIRRAGIIPNCDLVSIPGGESTTISRLIDQQGMTSELHDHVAANKPLLATCAGLIVCSRDPADDRVTPLGLLDVSVERNAFGRQRDSFEAPIDIEGLSSPFPGVFIRAPIVSDPGEASVIARYDGEIIAVRSGSITATAFHPELTTDVRVHRLAFDDEW